MLEYMLPWAAGAAAGTGAPDGKLPWWAPYAIVGGVLAAVALFVGLLMLRRRPKKVVYRGGIPDVLSRRFLLYEEDVKPKQKRSIGDEYLSADRIEDALEFFGYAGDREGILKLKAAAVEQGCCYLLERVAEFVPELAGDEDWARLAENAERLDRGHDAQRARQILRGPEADEDEDSSAEADEAENT